VHQVGAFFKASLKSSSPAEAATTIQHVEDFCSANATEVDDKVSKLRQKMTEKDF
jgi:hypothetical protein